MIFFRGKIIHCGHGFIQVGKCKHMYCSYHAWWHAWQFSAELFHFLIDIRAIFTVLILSSKKCHEKKFFLCIISTLVYTFECIIKTWSQSNYHQIFRIRFLVRVAADDIYPLTLWFTQLISNYMGNFLVAQIAKILFKKAMKCRSLACDMQEKLNIWAKKKVHLMS